MVAAGFPAVYVAAATARESLTGMVALGYNDSNVTRHYVRDDMGATATLFLLDSVASNCEYSSADTYTASNLRSLTRDYHPRVVTYGYYNGEIGVVLLASLDDDMVDMLVGLRQDYPVYDEEDHSALESELAYDAWDQYVWMDLCSDLQDRLDALGVDPAPLVEDIAPEATVKDWFYGNGYPVSDVHHDPIDYYGEGGCPDSVVFADMAEVTARIGDLLVARWESALLAPFQGCPDQSTLAL